MGKREDVAAILADMKRHGFRQLRKTDHGWLYGFNEFRVHVPNGLADPGSIDQRAIADMRATWEAKRAEVLGAYPGLKLKALARAGRAGGERPDALALEPVADVEDVLREVETGGAGAGPEPVMLAPAGSTPARSATDADAGTATEGPAALISAPEGSSPSGAPTDQPTNREEDGVSKRTKQRKSYTAWTCPKCGDTFKHAGRHAGTCKGKPREARGAPETNGKPARGPRISGRETSLHSQVTTVAADDYKGMVAQFSEASAALAKAFSALITERDHYKKERDESTKKWEQLRAVLK